mgnify:CR=1 FL=1
MIELGKTRCTETLCYCFYQCNLWRRLMHNLIPFNQLAGEEFDTDNDSIADYYECLIECDESQSVCKRICKEVLV